MIAKKKGESYKEGYCMDLFTCEYSLNTVCAQEPKAVLLHYHGSQPDKKS